MRAAQFLMKLPPRSKAGQGGSKTRTFAYSKGGGLGAGIHLVAYPHGVFTVLVRPGPSTIAVNIPVAEDLHVPWRL